MRPASYIRVLNRLNQTRWMHSDGRNVPNAPSQSSMAHGTPAGSIPPSGTPPNPSVSLPTVPPPPEITPTPANDRLSSSSGSSLADEKGSDYNTDYIPQYDKYGILRPVRPRRKIPVRLPGGHLEPPQYPPSEKWVEENAEDVQTPHPLWKFFYVPDGAMLAPNTSQTQPPFMGSLKFFNTNGAEESFSKGGRSWRVPDLRLKSFQNLHTIWWLCLRELNILATLKAERKRVGISYADAEYFYERKAKARGTMANIKIVLNGRRLALIASASPFAAPTPELPPRTDPINQQGALKGTTWLPASLPNLTKGRRRGEKARKKGREMLVARTRWPASIWEEQARTKAAANSTTDTVLAVEGETDPIVAAHIASEPPTAHQAEATRPKYYTAQEVYDMLRPEFLGESEYEEQDSEEPVVEDNQVSEEEVESRDEGFGGGREAEEFVEHTDVGEDGKVRQR